MAALKGSWSVAFAPISRAAPAWSNILPLPTALSATPLSITKEHPAILANACLPTTCLPTMTVYPNAVMGYSLLTKGAMTATPPAGMDAVRPAWWKPTGHASTAALQELHLA